MTEKINRAYLPIIELTPNPDFHWDITSQANAQVRPFRIDPGGLDDAFQPLVLGNIDKGQQQAFIHILQGPIGFRYGSAIEGKFGGSYFLCYHATHRWWEVIPHRICSTGTIIAVSLCTSGGIISCKTDGFMVQPPIRGYRSRLSRKRGGDKQRSGEFTILYPVPEIWAEQSVFEEYPARKAGVYSKYGILADIIPLLRTFRE